MDWTVRLHRLFSLLVLGIVGIPRPDEWLLAFSGYLVFGAKSGVIFLKAFTTGWRSAFAVTTVAGSAGYFVIRVERNTTLA